MSNLSDRVQDDIEKSLVEWLANGDVAGSVEDGAYDVAREALESSLVFPTDVIETWREAGMPDSDDPQGRGIVEQMRSAVSETFLDEDFDDTLDEAVSQFIDQNACDDDAVLDCLAQYGWKDAWALLVAGESQEGEDG